MITREQTVIELDGESIPITALPATSNIKYFKILQKVLVPILTEQSKEGATYADMIKVASEKFSDVEVDVIKALIVESTGMSPAEFELKFSRKIMKMYTLAKEIVMYNYEDVFTELGLEIN